ncbi:GNAT family N-acetyltransferase [Paenibacillus dokdonensis]|uniref:GNAT family N-acetyltransferase n=1 Tax=Paenibacillus dokdonensis TaxID=2567944 RepID=UPI0010A796A6|nr:GNAT family N-acetyltransferase [Paenibacillus dokdonensis]
MRINEIFDSTPLMETPRLLLRKLSVEDAEEYFSLASNPLAAKHTIWNAHITIEDSISYLSGLQAKMDQGQAFHWGIIDKATGTFIGRVGFIYFDTLHRLSEVGFALHCDWWGQGIMSEAALPMIRYGFEELGLNRIEGRCNADNLASERVLLKIGMTFEGILRRQLKIKGVFIDQKMYAILNSDFNELHEDALGHI